MEAAFLEDIIADPDDVATRLIFADWLSEQVDPAQHDRSEFIRLQHTLVAGKLRQLERLRLFARQRELLELHRQQWEESFRELVCSCEYRNGFAERVTLNVEQLVLGFPDLVQRTPVVRVRLHGLTPDRVTDVAASGSLSRLRELDLQREGIQAPTLQALLTSPHLTRLRSLNLARNFLGDEGDPGADPVQRPRPTSLDLNLSGVGMSRSGLRELLHAAAACDGGKLRWLVLHRAPRLAPQDFPAIPATWPLQLRQSIVDQVSDAALQTPQLLEELYPIRGTLPEEMRRWVEWFHGDKGGNLVRGLTLLPLPAPLQKAFAAVCQRRVVWRASRSGGILPVIPADADNRTADLAGLVQILLTMARSEEAEEFALRECFLDLYQRYQREELPPDGKTRCWDDSTLASDRTEA